MLFLEMLLQLKDLEPEQLPPGTVPRSRNAPLGPEALAFVLRGCGFCLHEQIAEGISVAQLCSDAASRC